MYKCTMVMRTLKIRMYAIAYIRTQNFKAPVVRVNAGACFLLSPWTVPPQGRVGLEVTDYW